MFWLVIAAPFLVLACAAAIARRGIIARISAALALIFLLIDAVAFLEVLSKSGRSTDPIGLGIIAICEFAIASVVFVASFFARKKRVNDSAVG